MPAFEHFTTQNQVVFEYAGPVGIEWPDARVRATGKLTPETVITADSSLQFQLGFLRAVVDLLQQQIERLESSKLPLPQHWPFRTGLSVVRDTMGEVR
jgi:hypothetical protein